MTKRLHVLLPKDRTKMGWFHLYGEDGEHLQAGRALGKADNDRAAKEGNPERITTLPYGDTPAGRFKLTRVHPVSAEKQPRMGVKWLPIEGESGDAAVANQVRTSLGIHAGRDGDPRTQAGELVPTNGCVRIAPRAAGMLWANIGSSAVLVTVEDLE
jgi:hypothetical protein